MRVKVYCAHSMTGLPAEEVLELSAWATKILTEHNIEVLDPAIAEGVKFSKKIINTPYKTLDGFWKRDKQMIRDAHVLVDLTPERKSEGVTHEIGYARYFLWKPVIRVYPQGKIPSNLSVAYFEDDFVTDSLDVAAQHINFFHGTWGKRFVWRIKLYLRCFPKALYYKLLEWK